VPQIEVAFDIDANGIVHVSAKDLGTGKEQSIRITAPEKLSKDEIEKMVKQAEQFADADKKRQQLAEAKNQADQLVYSTEKSLKEFGEKLSASDREKIEENAKALKDALKTDDAETIKRLTDELMQASHKLAEEIYKKGGKSQTAASGQPKAEPAGEARGKARPGEGEGRAGEENVVDAEFRVEDEK